MRNEESNGKKNEKKNDSNSYYYNLESDNINPKKSSVRIAGIYMIFGLIWIVTSDEVLSYIIHSQDVYKFFQTIKGFLYILITTILLYFLILNRINKIQAITKELFTKHEELNATYEELIATEEDLQIQYEKIKSTNKLLKESQERFQLVLDGANDAIWDWNMEDDRVYFGSRWKDMLGLSENMQATSMKDIFQYIHPDDRKKTRAVVSEYFKGKVDNYESTFRLKTAKGNYKWILNRGKAVWDENGKPIRMVGSSRDITQQKEMEEKIHKLAYYDDLTKLTNKNYFKIKLESLLRNNSNKEFAILYLGIDNFKKINNTMGLNYGDEVLKYIAIKLQKYKEQVDIISYFGGDEFVLLVTENVNNSELRILVKDIFKSIESLWDDNLISHYINISVGASEYPKHGNAYYELLKNATSAMYEVKKKGGNSFKIYNEDIYLRVLEEVNIENDLRKAIVNEEFTIYYQPKIRLNDKNIVGVEALIRWVHPEKGLISPLKFITVAENTGLIKDIGDWIVKEVFKQLSIWNSMGFKLTVSINISPKEIKQKNFVSKITKQLKEVKINPESIEFEITEGVFLENITEAIGTVTEIRELGIKVSLDDFGTGYSSLSYLKNLPIDVLKLDKAFIEKLDDEKNLSIIKSIIDLAHVLGLEVVAEGIETLKDTAYLQEIDCDLGQGYYFYKPMPAKELEKILLNKIT